MKKTRLFFSALIALSILLVLAFSGCDATEYAVKYEITGPETDAYVFFTYEKGNGATPVKIPWEKTVVFSGHSAVKNLTVSCEVAYLSLSNYYTLNIYVDGELKATDSTNGSKETLRASYRF
jgi:hypothetical protein